MESNVQKIQKALDKIIVITTEWQGSLPFGEVRKIAKAARKLPLRNCDVGSAEEQDARFVKWRYSNPLRAELGLDALAWAQMPYAPDTKKEERKDAE